jgi:hypothetical protein
MTKNGELVFIQKRGWIVRAVEYEWEGDLLRIWFKPVAYRATLNLDSFVDGEGSESVPFAGPQRRGDEFRFLT